MKSLPELELVLLAAIWGASFLFMRLGSPEFGPLLFMALRTSIACLFLVLCLLFYRQLASLKTQFLQVFVVGQLNTAIPFVLFGYATLTLSAGTTSVLNGTTPMFGAIVAYFWLKDKLSPVAIIGLILGFLGVYVLMAGSVSVTSENVLLPTLAVMLAALCYGISANFTKKYLSKIKPLTLAAGSQLSASITLAPLSLFFLPEKMPSEAAIYSVFTLGILCTGVAYIIFFRLISALGPAKAISVTYLIPVFGIIWGVIFLEEVFTLKMLLGCVIIMLGVALTTGVFKKSLVKKAHSDESSETV